MTSRELTAWKAWETVNGRLGASRQDLLAANIAATVANGRLGRRAKPYTIGDFLVFSLAGIDSLGSGAVDSAEAFRAMAAKMVAAGEAKKQE